MNGGAASASRRRSIWSPEEESAWAPPRPQTVSEWADDNRILTESSAEPGPWRTARAPYLREIQDAFGNRHVPQITFCKSTQVGGTESLLNAIAWTICRDPKPVMWVGPRDEDVEQIFRRRIMPMVERTQALMERLGEVRSDWQRREIGFRGATLYGRAAGSPAGLASIAVGLLVGDEAEKWPGFSGKESAPWDLACERTRTFVGSTIALVSTPVLEEGLIWREFLDGDRRRYFLPCPHCEEWNTIEWSSFRWPEELDQNWRRIRREHLAHVECPSCGGEWRDEHKPKQLAMGAWRPELEASEHRSYHIWAAYSPWLTYSDVVAQWLRWKDTEAGRQHFMNSWRGLPWREQIESPTKVSVASRAEAYHRDQLPPDAKPRAITMGVDVQKIELPYVVRAWGDGGESWLLRAGFARSWSGLEEILVGRWQDLGVRICLIDYRYRSEEVFEFARAHPEIVRPIRGVHRETGQLYTTSRVDRHPGTGRPLRRSLVVWHVTVDPFRDWLAAAIAGNGPEWHIHADVGETYLVQLSSQEKVMDRTGRKHREVWRTKAGFRAEHLWDCEVYAKVAANMIAADRSDNPKRAAALERLRSREEKIRQVRQARRQGGGYLGDLGR